jgi:hypothetical protein
MDGYTPLQLYLLLKDRSSAEISGRLLDRAEAFEKLDTNDDFYRRCAVLDRLASEQIERLVAQLNPDKDIALWCKLRDDWRKQASSEKEIDSAN